MRRKDQRAELTVMSTVDSGSTRRQDAGHQALVETSLTSSQTFGFVQNIFSFKLQISYFNHQMIITVFTLNYLNYVPPKPQAVGST